METPVLIVGSGPAGAATALFLARQGIRSVIVEKELFPRYHIGESLTGECGNCLHQLGLKDLMGEIHFPIKYGVKVYGEEGNNTFYVPVMARTPDGQLMEASTYQVRRSTFDKALMDEAIARGTVVIEGEAARPIIEDGRVRGAYVKLASRKMEPIRSQVLVDASGRYTFLSNKGVTGKKERGGYDNQVAIFSQFTNVVRDRGLRGDDTLIFYRKRFHWAWYIPLDEETVSIGVVTPTDYFQSKNESKPAFLLRELKELNPELARLTPEATMTEEVRAISNYSYHIRSFTGDGFLCVGDSHRFIDPVFSFGVYFSIKEAEFASGAIAAYLGNAEQPGESPFADFERTCERGQDTIQALIDAFWNNPLGFAYFTHFRYKEDFIDLFAGRVYTDTPSPGLSAIFAINEQAARTPAAVI